MKRKIKSCFFKKHIVFPILRAQTKHRINKVFPEKGGKTKHEKSNKKYFEYGSCCQYGGNGMPGIFCGNYFQ